MIQDFLDIYISVPDSPWLAASTVFLVFILLAKIANLFTVKVVSRFSGFTKTQVDDHIIKLIHRPVFYTILLIGAISSIKIYGASDKILFYANASLMSLITIMWSICIIRISNIVISSTFHKMADLTGLGREITPLIENIWKVVVIVGSAVIILSLWDLDISPLLASAGIAGVAIALAAKDTLSNFFGGVSIFIDKPYRIGDYIVLDQGERGEVVSIGIRSTRIKTRDDILITIPNAIIANTKIINESAPIPNFRVRVPISVAYGSCIETVESILMDTAMHNTNILKEPEPRVRFRSFGESGLQFELLCWAMEPSMRGRTLHELNCSIYNSFNTGKIKMPFPHRTIYLREEKNWQT
ncbi:mechanosensitive ion channel family protein [bacterium]|nr:mechanosensitive ion channel family protein [bacterium]